MRRGMKQRRVMDEFGVRFGVATPLLTRPTARLGAYSICFYILGWNVLPVVWLLSLSSPMFPFSSNPIPPLMCVDSLYSVYAAGGRPKNLGGREEYV